MTTLLQQIPRVETDCTCMKAATTSTAEPLKRDFLFQWLFSIAKKGSVTPALAGPVIAIIWPYFHKVK